MQQDTNRNTVTPASPDGDNVDQSRLNESHGQRIRDNETGSLAQGPDLASNLSQMLRSTTLQLGGSEVNLELSAVNFSSTVAAQPLTV